MNSPETALVHGVWPSSATARSTSAGVRRTGAAGFVWRCCARGRAHSAFHEPRLLSPSLSSIRNGGEGARRAGEEALRFMASIHVPILEVFPTHEPMPSPGSSRRNSGTQDFNYSPLLNPPRLPEFLSSFFQSKGVPFPGTGRAAGCKPSLRTAVLQPAAVHGLDSRPDFGGVP